MVALAQPITIWHGSMDEGFDLAKAIEHNCECERNEAGVVTTVCSSHHVYDVQRTLNGLLFARYLLPTLRAQEWSKKAKPAT